MHRAVCGTWWGAHELEALACPPIGQSGEDASETEHVVNDGWIRDDAGCQGRFWAETGSESDQDMK